MLPTKFKKKKEENSNIVSVSNSLIECFVHKNNMIALKILFYIAKSTLIIDQDKEIMTLIIDGKKLADTVKTDSRTIKRNLKKMVETSITFVAKDQYEAYVSLILEAKINYGGHIEIKMFTKILSLVRDVNGRFTPLDFENMMNLKLKHSLKMIQLLEMIARFSKHVAKRKYYSLEELNGLFGTNYKSLYAFEQKILTRVKTELDAESGLSFTYRKKMDKENAKAGRPNAVGIYLEVINNKNRQAKLF